MKQDNTLALFVKEKRLICDCSRHVSLVGADEDEVMVVVVAAVVAVAVDPTATSSVLGVLYCASATAEDVVHKFKAPVVASAGGT